MSIEKKNVDNLIADLLSHGALPSAEIERRTGLSQIAVGESISRLSDKKRIEPNIIGMVVYWQVKQ